MTQQIDLSEAFRVIEDMLAPLAAAWKLPDTAQGVEFWRGDDGETFIARFVTHDNIGVEIKVDAPQMALNPEAYIGEMMLGIVNSIGKRRDERNKNTPIIRPTQTQIVQAMREKMN